MKCALNDRNLYKVHERYVCTNCAFEKYNNTDLCVRLDLCDIDSILKQICFQSDIFKL